MSMVRIGLAAIYIVLISACSVSDRWIHEDAEGLVPETFFSSVKKNKTRKAWMADQLGPPQSTLTGPHREQIDTYHFSRTQYRSVSFLLFFRYTGSVHDVEYYHVMYCDGLVEKAWWDKFDEVDVDRITRRSKCSRRYDKKASTEMPEASS